MEFVVGLGWYLKGICVDFERGIFMISCIFLGIMYLIYCVYKIYIFYDVILFLSLCEINECMDVVRVVR